MAIPITPLKRQIKLHGLDSPVNLIINQHGVEMTVAGARTRIFGSWELVAKALLVPAEAPSIYHAKPFEFLKHIASRMKRKDKQ